MMKKLESAQSSETNLARYDWTRAKRGRLAGRAAKASALLRILDADLAARFPDSRSVNEALRAMVAIEDAMPRKRTRRRRAA
jgi:hypothetical protein